MRLSKQHLAEPVPPATEAAPRQRSARDLRRRARLVRRALVAGDVFALSAAFLLAEFVVGSAGISGRISVAWEVLAFAVTLPGWVVVARLYGLYGRDDSLVDHSTADDLVGVFHLVTVGAAFIFAATAVTNIANPDPRKFASFWAMAIALIALSRTAARAALRRTEHYAQNAVIVGAGAVGQLLARKLLSHPEYGVRVVGFVEAQPAELREEAARLPILGPPSSLPEIVALHEVERVIIAFWDESDDAIVALVRRLKYLDVQIDIAPRLHELIGPTAIIHTVEGFPLIVLPPAQLSRVARGVKRLMDVVLSALGLILVSPLFAVVAVLIKLDSRGPVFYKQVRMGAGDRTFMLVKFRTMTPDADVRKREVAHLNVHQRSDRLPLMFKVRDDPRVTRVGRVLRRYFIDELPQLINVLRGEMSLVGPRPLILDEDQYVVEWARKRLDLRPGMTGMWQVLGRSTIPFEEMVKLDYMYVTNWSLYGDLRILLRTIPLMLRGEAANY